MPKKIEGERREYTVSTKITAFQNKQLQNLARDFYIKNYLKLPTVSELLRTIIDEWLSRQDSNGKSTQHKGEEEVFSHKEDLSKPRVDNPGPMLNSTQNNRRLQD